ncbi:acyltransferase family protein [Nocardioides sp. Kera G14]|uniref:acyltransferase family protein n=1 Tax=Nocardioides sp. Kera G14 TaxID=2884264 RepID=UPI001D100F1F|nr:acyltransferase [Nocardioides sp. Kera G14]UDY24927.1 acyltransferase [Nocardioides sp. Kera G14]
MTASADVAAPVNTAGRYAHVDAMRAFAVMLVVVAHAGLDKVVPGGSGVTIFFSISGFVITWVTIRERVRTGGFGLRGFYERRLLKLGPPLALVVVVPSLIWTLWKPLGLVAVLSQVFFFFNWVRIDTFPDSPVLPGSAVVWSLAIEEQFYIIFALLWLLVARRPNAVRLLGWAAAAVLVISSVERLILAMGLADPENRIYYGTDTRIDGIALGTLTALLVHRGLSTRLGRPWILIAAVVLFLTTLLYRDPLFRDTLRYTLQSVAACAVIAFGFATSSADLIGRLFRTLAGASIVQLLGRASYSIYLAHYSMDYLIGWLWPDLPRAAGIPAKILVGVAVGVLIFEIVEKPVAAWNARRTGRTL